MRYVIFLIKETEKTYKGSIYFNLEYDSEEAIIGMQDRLDDFDLLLRADSEFTYKNSKFSKRGHKVHKWYTLNNYSEGSYQNLCEKYQKEFKKELPSGNLDELLDYYAQEMGFVNFEHFVNEFNEYQAKKIVAR